MKFGNVLVIGYKGQDKHKKAKWAVRCACGNEKVTLAATLKSGGITSCGCLRRERSKGINVSHGRTGTPEWNAWQCMKRRCNNPNHSSKRWYHEKGVTYCSRWERFEEFFQDMGEMPRGSRYTLDRIDGSRGYEPGNCRWATYKEQANNRSNNVFVEVGKKVLTSIEASKVIGIKDHALRKRLECPTWYRREGNIYYPVR